METSTGGRYSPKAFLSTRLFEPDIPERASAGLGSSPEVPVGGAQNGHAESRRPPPTAAPDRRLCALSQIGRCSRGREAQAHGDRSAYDPDSRPGRRGRHLLNIQRRLLEVRWLTW
jgi:hypothetical protein